MTSILYWSLSTAQFFLVLAMGCALVRILRGPSAQDRVMGMDCLYVNGMLLILLLGSLLALIGSFGLVHLKSFFQRIHAPTLVATMGMWCITLATIVYFSVQGGQIYLHGLLITFFIALTTPITTIFLMRAALFRERMSGRNTVPPTVSTPLKKPE